MQDKREAELIEIIQKDAWMVKILKTVEKLNLPDCWVCAGFIRNKVWDFVHSYNVRTQLNDIDVIYFDPSNISQEVEKKMESTLRGIMPAEPWSVKNQARMHMKNQSKPYTSSLDGISHFPEIPTAIGAKIINGKIQILAPYGVSSLFDKRVEPTPYFTADKELHTIYHKRIQSKDWKRTWPELEIL
ncbi:nucleotidyltransferase family protein [Rummeliibacillus pycnus]|uniref:nucleotidyltransferase family protein n=1 Tax=Rummeliibacillus pycnus TaxID=101070 RepID=UPI003D2A7ED8